MRHSTILSTMLLALFYVLPTLAITSGKAWVNFYKDCPADETSNEIVEIEELTFIISSLTQPFGSRVKGVASPTISPSSLPSSIRPSPSSSASSSASVFPSPSASASASASASTSSSTVLSKRSQFRSALAARNADKATIKSPYVNVTQGVCQPVPIVTPSHIDSRSVSVEVELLNLTPFQQCNITVHEVAGCIDPPLIEAPVHNGEAKSDCKLRDFVAWSDVWVRLDCSEVGTDSILNTVSKTRPVRRVF